MKKIYSLLVMLMLVTPLSSFATDFSTLIFGTANPKVKYMGQLADNGKDKSGIGIQRQGGGNIYIGDFNLGVPSGYGMLIIGEKGKIKNADGAAFYVGEWINGKKEGIGTCYSANGDVIYSGKFGEDRPYGQYPSRNVADDVRYFSAMEYSQGRFYIGEVVKGVAHGFGMFILSDGSYLVGNVSNGDCKGMCLHIYDASHWEVQKWQGTGYTILYSSDNYDERVATYKEVKARQSAEFRAQLFDVLLGLAQVSADVAVAVSGGTTASSGYSAPSSSSSSSSGSTKSHSSSSKSTNKSSDCGTSWMTDSRTYSNYESQLIKGGLSESDINSIKSKMRAIRNKWTNRGCPFTKSSYE